MITADSKDGMLKAFIAGENEELMVELAHIIYILITDRGVQMLDDIEDIITAARCGVLEKCIAPNGMRISVDDVNVNELLKQKREEK